ncbi:Fe-S-binding ATPase [Comamonas serinivorans]|uniref:Iron-sulfur cluster carrier protein n=1 Tax=Comamonas serinivorans TaxID=1082851 RepID=A0A1Y0EQB3_9BURK|nr:iron-sulfur cluster carrier protein ApbC [Comamonas serinivorans]ARU05591.1 Fe-S-binding ATPase [Comamonas serinivorans]
MVFSLFQKSSGQAPDASVPPREAVLQALATVVDDDLGRDVVAAKLVRQVQIDRGQVSLELVLPYPAQSKFDALREAAEAAVRALPEVTAVQVSVRSEVVAHAAQRGVQLLPGVKNIIAVASGKGGVGKSTTAANLALALAAEGATVGLLDADIYGPSQPLMMGLAGHKPETTDGKTMEPLEAHGVQVISIGFLVAESQAMIWRGPMATQALDQLLRGTRWRDLDYLLVDLPPGTGDIQLSLAQRVPLTGAVIVTTPQDIALLDVRKGITLFEKVNVPILGVIENMAVHVCSQCGHSEHIFGAGGGARIAGEMGVKLLASMPLSLSIREQADGGTPTVAADPDSANAALYRAAARQLAVAVASTAKDYSNKFPTITVSNT